MPAGGTAADEAEFSASGTVIGFAGFLRAMSKVPTTRPRPPSATCSSRRSGRGRHALGPGHRGALDSTQPPARYTEASLVEALEELGIGRPSTYAASLRHDSDTAGTSGRRALLWCRRSRRSRVVGLLERYFAELVDYGFTAAMEDDLDEIAQGEQEVLPWLTRFYFGGNGSSVAAPDSHRGLKEDVASHLGEIDAREVNSITIGTDGGGEPIVVRVGRYGPYLQRGEDRASIPEDLPPDELTVERAEEMFAAPSGDRTLGTDPDEGLPVIARTGRFGPYVQLGEGVDGGERPRTASLFRSMALETVALDEALELLRLPRIVGIDPFIGRGDPGAERPFRSVSEEGDRHPEPRNRGGVVRPTLDEALVLFAQPKTCARTAAAPLGARRGSGHGRPSSCAPGASVPTSPTVRPTPRCARVTTRRRSPTSAPSSPADRRAAGPPVKRAGRTAKATKSAKAAKSTKKAAKPAKATGAGKATAKKAAAKRRLRTEGGHDDEASEGAERRRGAAG